MNYNDTFFKGLKPQFDELVEALFIEDEKQGFRYDSPLSSYETFTPISKLKVSLKTKFWFYVLQELLFIGESEKVKGATAWFPNGENTKKHFILLRLSNSFEKQSLKFNQEEIAALIQFHLNVKRQGYSIINYNWNYLLNHVERFCKQNGLTEPVKSVLQSILNHKEFSKNEYHYYESKRLKTISKVEGILFKFDKNKKEDAIKPIKLDEGDEFGRLVNAEVEGFSLDLKRFYYTYFAIAQKVSGGKPSQKWLKEVEQTTEVHQAHLQKSLNKWLLFTAKLKNQEITHTNTYNNHVYTYIQRAYLSQTNSEILKGMIWSIALMSDKELLQNLTKLIERSYEKIQGVGPAAASVGNAGLWVLSNTEGLEGVNYLSRLRLRIRQANTQALIAKYLQEAATKRGMTTADIEDLAADDFGLTEGVRSESFGDFMAELVVVGIGKTEIRWKKPDGTYQKSEPSVAKTQFAEQLKTLKADAKQIQISLTVQRDRIDRQFRVVRWMPFEHFQNCYFKHGLLSFLSKKLIWEFKIGENDIKIGFWHGENWCDTEGGILEIPMNCVIKIWHPAEHTVTEVQRWRALLETFQIQQPMKQAHREVYWLTAAEENTRTYSNRFAGHILKQHQFNSLAKLRGWRYSLLGAYDKGYDSEKAIIEIPEAGFKVEFWVSEVNQDDQWNDTGIWNYISTDQVRFIRLPTPENPRLDEVSPLSEVPTLLFSEILRDVDMFVGVASVGNDPAWRDNGGMPQFRDYWQSYSFGELGETAKTRRDILQKILPKLKIASIASLDDKFLVVKGKLRTYKIHLGSTNILMTPNDQYLCIVPDRSKAKEENLFLPFEGDAGLSVIISKAFLLAADDKITDSTITSQIKRK